MLFHIFVGSVFGSADPLQNLGQGMDSNDNQENKIQQQRTTIIAVTSIPSATPTPIPIASSSTNTNTRTSTSTITNISTTSNTRTTTITITYYLLITTYYY